MARFLHTNVAHLDEDVFEPSSAEHSDDEERARDPGYSAVVENWIEDFWEEDWDSPNPAQDQAVAFAAALTAQSTTGANFFRTKEPSITPQELGLKDKEAVEHARKYDPAGFEAKKRQICIKRRRVENAKPIATRIQKTQPDGGADRGMRQQSTANVSKVHEAITIAGKRVEDDRDEAIQILNTLAYQRPDLRLECALEKERWAARRIMAKRQAEQEEREAEMGKAKDGERIRKKKEQVLHKKAVGKRV